MKTILQRFSCYLLITVGLLSAQLTVAQINYTENFNNGMGDWGDFYFYDTDEVPCSGAGAAVASVWDWYPEAEMISPSLGTSNGGQLTISYQYKILNYGSLEPTENSENWGILQIYYATSPTGPWTLLQTVDPTNHIESENCATKTASFYPPAGSNVYIGVYIGLGNLLSDFVVYFDEFSATQAAPVTCSGAPAASVTNATSSFLCNGASTTLSLGTQYTTIGLTYQWQSSTDGINFTDVATGGNNTTYTTTQAATTWYRARVSCGTDFIFTTPIEITSNGLDCLCDISFSYDVEPITLVNFAGINNTSSPMVNGTPALQNFTSLAPGTITQGQSYPITLKGNTAGNFENYFTVYFDWNHNGDLTDEGEEYQIGFITNSTGVDAIVATGTIQVPVTAMTGYTYMRVVKNYDEFTDTPCDSENLFYGQAEDYIVMVQACVVDAPEADTTQTLCANATVGQLEAEGEGIKWYADETGGSSIAPGTALENGSVYYASQTVGGCESTARTAVTVTINEVEAPQVLLINQTFCEGDTVDQIQVGAQGEVVWYIAETDGSPLADNTIIENPVYYASQIIDGCESARVAVPVTLNIVVAPAGDATHVYTHADTMPFIMPFSDLEIETEDGAIITWYTSEEDAENGENGLTEEDFFTESGTYYVTQTVGGCESEPFAVTVDVILGSEDFMAGNLKVYPNPVKDVFTVTYTEPIASVTIYNLVGQKVLNINADSDNLQIDMSQMPAGTYIAKIATAGAVKSYKIIKQ